MNTIYPWLWKKENFLLHTCHEHGTKRNKSELILFEIILFLGNSKDS